MTYGANKLLQATTPQNCLSVALMNFNLNSAIRLFNDDVSTVEFRTYAAYGEVKGERE
jgi:hypothetical protein